MQVRVSSEQVPGIQDTPRGRGFRVDGVGAMTREHLMRRRTDWLWARVCCHKIHYVHETKMEAQDADRKERREGWPMWCGPHKIVKLVQSPKATK